MFSYLYYRILLLIIAPHPKSYMECCSVCSVIVSRTHLSLQSAWDDCAAMKDCKGVIEQNCNWELNGNSAVGNSFFACGERVQGDPSKGFNGCFYVKPSGF